MEKTNRQQALWENKKTFTTYAFDEKNSKVKQKEVTSSEQEIKDRDLILNYPKYESEGKKVNVYQTGVYLVSSKEKEIEPATSAGLTKPSTNMFASRAKHKRLLDEASGGSVSTTHPFFHAKSSKSKQAAEKETHKDVTSKDRRFSLA